MSYAKADLSTTFWKSTTCLSKTKISQKSLGLFSVICKVTQESLYKGVYMNSNLD